MSIRILAQQRTNMKKLAEEAEKSLQAWSKLILDELKPTPGPYAFFNHNAHALERVKDVHRILERLYEERTRLRILDEQEDAIRPAQWPGGTPFPPEVQQVMQQANEVNELVKMYFESLYMFGNMLLDQWSLCVAYSAGLSKPEKFNFLGIVQLFEGPKDRGSLSPLWDEFGPTMLWLNGQMRFYRNRFVVHADRPWQRGNTRSTYGTDYTLFVPSPPGWINDEDISSQIRELLPLAPQWLQEASDGYWEKARPRALLDRLLNHIGEIKNKSDRETILRLVGQYGTTTPSFQVVGDSLLAFIANGTSILQIITKQHIPLVNLGNPHK